MGKKSKSKTSRKGKREWRANISTHEIDDYVERIALDDRSGGVLEHLPSEALFFTDKSEDVTVVRKVSRHRSKVLQADSILQRNSLIPILKEPGHSDKKRKDRDHAKPLVRSKPMSVSTVAISLKEKPDGVFDIWGRGFGEEVLKGKKHLKKAKIDVPAVEVDGPGCSYNPTFEDHQEVLGLAVADEMQKVYKKELQPAPVPVFVAGSAIDEEDRYYLEADNEDVEEDPKEVERDAELVESNSKPVKVKKLTRAELNRKARRRGVVKAETLRLEKLKVQKDVQRIPEIMEDIREENEDKEIRRIRRIVSREEKSAQGPPRLGRHKFKPEPKQVLLTEEVTGSLRKLRAYPMLVRERFRSLQRRGILEPRVQVRRKEKKKWVEIQQGTRGQKERDMHAAMLAEKEAKRQGLAVIPL